MLVRLVSCLVVALAMTSVSASFGSEPRGTAALPMAESGVCDPAPERPWTAALMRAGISLPELYGNSPSGNHQGNQSPRLMDDDITIAQSCRWDYCCGDWGCWFSCPCW
ncbi:MAG: hypothetical protein AAF563_01360 [Pseudomonadota bacterium]